VRGLEVGQRVALDSSSACGRCANCRNARQELCTGIQSMFHIGSFGLAEEMIAPAVSALPYDGLPATIACLQEPLGVAIDMVRLTEIGPTNNVLVIGPGPIGLMAVALAKRQGARRVFVAGRSTRPNRLAVAKLFGADDVFDSLAPRDFGCVIDRIMVTAPPPTIADAIALAGNGALITFIGLGFGEQANVQFDGNKFHFKKLQLRASFAAPALFGPLALQYLREKVVDGAALVSHRFSLAELPAAYETARTDPSALKVVITP
jgi:threonine dehydrogenase-like Zn-dependent dehydrogenase